MHLISISTLLQLTVVAYTSLRRHPLKVKLSQELRKTSSRPFSIEPKRSGNRADFSHASHAKPSATTNTPPRLLLIHPRSTRGHSDSQEVICGHRLAKPTAQRTIAGRYDAESRGDSLDFFTAVSQCDSGEVATIESIQDGSDGTQNAAKGEPRSKSDHFHLHRHEKSISALCTSQEA